MALVRLAEVDNQYAKSKVMLAKFYFAGFFKSGAISILITYFRRLIDSNLFFKLAVFHLDSCSAIFDGLMFALSR